MSAKRKPDFLPETFSDNGVERPWVVNQYDGECHPFRSVEERDEWLAKNEFDENAVPPHTTATV